MIHVYHLPYRRDLHPDNHWLATILSVLTHSAMLLILFGSLDWLPERPRPPQGDHLRKAVKLLLPNRELSRAAPSRQTLVARLAPATMTAAALPQPEFQVNLSAIQISFADDVGNQLPDVIDKQNGVLAFVEKKDPGFADYVAEPPDWQVRQEVQDVSGKTKLSMTPPERWSLVRTIAQAYSIPLADYQVNALFESSYAGCLRDAIRKKAMTDPRAANQSVQSARLGFASGSPCGVDVLDISFGGRLQSP